MKIIDRTINIAVLTFNQIIIVAEKKSFYNWLNSVKLLG